ncbi:MAG TPA: hypothetical protein VKU01_08170 [Bryobacteraceae bacterium]|nr:hypothetical protein [Bryobacteraceae bacterium]
MRRNPRFRFLVRASVLFVLLLVAWWFVFLQPVLVVMQYATRVELSAFFSDVVSSPDGSWDLTGIPEGGGSFRYHLGAEVLNQLAAGLPLFWALILAARWNQDSRRILATGTLALLLWINFSVLFQGRLLVVMLTAPPGMLKEKLYLASTVHIWFVSTVLPILLALDHRAGPRKLLFPAPAVDRPAIAA